MLKQEAVTEYLRELHNKYVLVPIDKAANNIAMICKKYSVTVIFKEIGILDAGNEMYEKIDKNQEEINIINRKKKAKSITTYDFSTLYTTLPHDKLIKMLCNVIDFVFEGENRTHICISKNNVKYLWQKSKDNIAFSKSTSKTSLKHLMQNCYFMIGNLQLRQKISILMGIDPAPFSANLFLYTY